MNWKLKDGSASTYVAEYKTKTQHYTLYHYQSLPEIFMATFDDSGTCYRNATLDGLLKLLK